LIFKVNGSYIMAQPSMVQEPSLYRLGVSRASTLFCLNHHLKAVSLEDAMRLILKALSSSCPLHHLT
jgi:hypothetical protein